MGGSTVPTSTDTVALSCEVYNLLIRCILCLDICQKKATIYLTPLATWSALMNTVPQRILKRIRTKGRGTVFTAKDFLDLGSRAAVDQTLSRLVRKGHIRRLGRGLYDFPRSTARLGTLSPLPDEVAKVLARKTDSRLQLSGARAANALGLSTQVPARIIYLTDGRSRDVRVGNYIISLRQASPRRLAGAGTIAGTVLQALSFIGKDRISDDVVRKLSHALSASDKAALKRHLANGPDWIRPIVDQIAQPA